MLAWPTWGSWQAFLVALTEGRNGIDNWKIGNVPGLWAVYVLLLLRVGTFQGLKLSTWKLNIMLN